jgi:hypothetical protein
MKLIATLLLAASLFAQSTATPPTMVVIPKASALSWFAEAGASQTNSAVLGSGLAIQITSAAVSQQIFAEVATGTVGAVTGQLFFGVKSNYPAATVKGVKLSPFSIVAYGGALSSVSKIKLSSLAGGLSASAVTSVGTSAGFAQKYAAGAEAPLSVGSPWRVGLGAQLDDSSGKWRGLPFVFVGRSF